MGFVFYDLETTGISPAFDQPLQFAAIRTDDHFVEIERINLRCRIAPHIIPSPQALIVTGVTPAQLVDPELPSLLKFTQTTMELTERWAPATWVGFNTIRFDEEVLPQALYQNLQPNIYATQFNGNNRLDILTAVYSVWCRNPGLLHWPRAPGSARTGRIPRRRAGPSPSAVASHRPRAARRHRQTCCHRRSAGAIRAATGRPAPTPA